MKICVCQFRRGENDKLIHITNIKDVTVVSTVHTKAGEMLRTTEGFFWRSWHHEFESDHGWETVT